MNTNVKLWIRTINDGQNLFNGTSFGETLFLELESQNKEDFKILHRKIEKKEIPGEHPHDTLDRLFIECVSIRLELAKQIMFCDVMKANCLFANADAGKEIIDLIELADLSFILILKKWKNSDSLELEFEACHEDYEYEVLNVLRKSNYDYNG